MMKKVNQAELEVPTDYCALRTTNLFHDILILPAVCCGLRDSALASHTAVRGFGRHGGGRLSSLTC